MVSVKAPKDYIKRVNFLSEIEPEDFYLRIESFYESKSVKKQCFEFYSFVKVYGLQKYWDFHANDTCYKNVYLVRKAFGMDCNIERYRHEKSSPFRAGNFVGRALKSEEKARQKV